MKKWLELSLTLGCAFLISNSAFCSTHKDKQSLDCIIAVVNKTIITKSELNEAIDRIQRQLLASHMPIPPENILRKQVLDQLINRKLQLDLAEQAGIHVAKAEVTKAINTVAQKNRIPIDKLYAAVAEQGLNEEEYRKEIHDEMTINHIEQQMMGGKIFVSPQEVDEFMHSPAWLSYNGKEYHLENILIALPEKPTPKDIAEAKARAERVLMKLHQGVSFHEAAIAESSDSKALQGGDLGWRKLPEIPSAFSTRLIEMKEHDVAGPIQTPNGFHIIHVVGIRNVGMQGNQEEQRKQVQALLYQRKYEEALQTWITKLRSESFINIHPEKCQ
ncbi:MAG: surA [Gammaproteobacteria bacterium]|jgi:peptidyl-prolyl cis-trans isomerase SurA|nr:surA [Gammaproteobacteria bacterium]